MVTGPLPALHPAHTFLSPDSALGFGISDTVELTVALLLALLILIWALVRRGAIDLRTNAPLCCALVAALPVLLRLLLLPRCPPPTPSGADDFSYLLLADTLRHFRFAMPAHAYPQFFEQMFVLQHPTYSSMYAMGQGLVLAFGWSVFGHPWAGVLLSVAALCGACYWMLRGWISPDWALVGGILAVFEFGPLSYWTNSYWGGAVSAIAGCLVFGSLPRLRHYGRTRDVILLGLGLALQLLTRPVEFCSLCVTLLLYFLLLWPTPLDGRTTLRLIALPALSLLLATVFMGVQNKQVTGSWTTLPYRLSQYQYGIPSTFTFQPNPLPHRQLNDEQDVAYRAQAIVHGDGHETWATYFERLVFRIRFGRFFVQPSLYLACLAFAWRLRKRQFAWVLLTILIFGLGSNFYPYFFPHYVAALASLFILLQVVGLDVLNRVRITAHRLPIPLGSLLLLLASAHFLFWFGVHASGDQRLLGSLGVFETWDYINYGDPQGRIAIDRELSATPGKKLVFVHYAPGHQFEEWVYNEADIDASPVVRVQDRGPAENQQLLTYYPHRSAWLLEPDQNPPRLTPYSAPAAGFQDVK